MKIALGADHRGMDTIRQLGDVLRSEGHELLPVGVCDDRSVDYPDTAYPVGQAVAQGQAQRGILICGSGIGMSIAANKVDGVRAALVHDEVGAEMSRRHNNANVLCLSADMLGQRIIEMIVRKWLNTEFEGGRHERRVEKITAIEQGKDPSSLGGAA